MVDRFFHFIRQIQLFVLFLLAPGGEDFLAKRLIVILAICISGRWRHAFFLWRDLRRQVCRRSLSPLEKSFVKEESPDHEKKKLHRFKGHTITSLKKQGKSFRRLPLYDPRETPLSAFP